MPLKRIYCRNEGKRLHKDSPKAPICRDAGLPERKPQGSPEQLPNKPQEPPRNAAQFAHLASPQFKNILVFAPFECPKIPRKHQSTPKKSLFLPLFSLFQPLLTCSECSHSPEPPDAPRCSQCCTIKTDASEETHKEREKGKGKEAEPASQQKRESPPLRQGAASRSPHHKFAPKNQEKVAWGRFEKIFGKIFRGNVSGVKKNPSRCLNGRGDDCLINLVNENRKISNLGNANNQKRTKALLNNRGQR